MRGLPVVIGLLLLSGALAFAEASPQIAKAELRNAQGELVGFATFTEGVDGVRVVAHVSGLKPGLHGFHIHEAGQCSAPDFKSAGGHFNPYNTEHGLMDPRGAHAGDLPNLLVGPDGTAAYVTLAPRVTLHGEKHNSLFHSKGTALVIHTGADDYKTEPSGESGGRVACGVISRFDRTAHK